MTLAACPGCVAVAPSVDAAANKASGGAAALHLALPQIRCAACIAGVEGVLAKLPSVQSARVNLGAKRVRIVLAQGYDADGALKALNDAGFEAHELDATALRPAADDTGRRLLARAAVAGPSLIHN